MIRVCAWCNREIHHDKLSNTETIGEIVPKEKQIPGTVTHGICQKCLDAEMQKQQQTKPPTTAFESFQNWVSRRQSSKGA